MAYAKEILVMDIEKEMTMVNQDRQYLGADGVLRGRSGHVARLRECADRWERYPNRAGLTSAEYERSVDGCKAQAERMRLLAVRIEKGEE